MITENIRIPLTPGVRTPANPNSAIPNPQLEALADLTRANTLALQRVAIELRAVSEGLALVAVAGERLAEVGEALAAGLAARRELEKRKADTWRGEGR